MKKIAIDYSVNVDQKLEEVIGEKSINNRAMFSSEIEEKILKHVGE